MAGFKGTGTADATLDAWLGSTTLGPGTVYIAAFTAAPTAAGGGTEVSGAGYARVSITNNSTSFPAASGGIKLTGVSIPFGTVGTGGWGTVVGLAVVQTASGALGASDIIYYGPLSVARGPLLAGDTFTVPVGDGQFTEA